MDKTLDKIIKKHIVLTVLTAVAVVCMMITITYGLYQTNHKNTVDQEIAIGSFDVNLTSNSGQITLADLNPGDAPNVVYTFTTSNSGDYTVAYNVYLTDNTTTFLENGANAQTYADYTKITSENYQYINYSLDNGEAKPLSSVLDSTTGRMTILSGRLEPSFSNDHTIKFSISSNAPNNLQGSILALNITMEASASKEAGVDKILKLATGANASSTDVITKEAPSGSSCTNTLAYDGTVDNNLRYVGANPCNYVSFNNELWRIIGVMNNVDDGTDKKETRIKLVRKDSLGRYSWDTTDSSINSGEGINDWSQADLMQELNNDYLNINLNSNTMWYNGKNNQKTREYNYTNGLKEYTQTLIDNTKWYLGGQNIDIYSLEGKGTATKFYEYERGTTVWGSISEQICNDGACPRALNWTGKVALMYPSDYGFSVGGEVRNICLEKNLSSYDVDNCYENNWLLFTVNYQWTISPTSRSSIDIFTINSAGARSSYNAYNEGIIRPSVYLKSTVQITGGDGSEESPYTLK